MKEIIILPDIGGGNAEGEIIEILVTPGEKVHSGQSLLILESDKASMEIPCPLNGIIINILVNVGHIIKGGDSIMELELDVKTKAVEIKEKAINYDNVSQQQQHNKTKNNIHAGPGVRKIARELGINLNLIKASGPKNRILKEDIQKIEKSQNVNNFGEIETISLNRVMEISAHHLYNSWKNIPHVTQFDNSDITELESFRKETSENSGVKVTLLAILIKVCVNLLKEMPEFNSSLLENKKYLILKKYYNIGFAVDTKKGLLVPVIHNVDKKSILDIAYEIKELAEQARKRQITLNNLQGSCFTISNLGHIGGGGTGFTPIINSPEVAILGISKARIQPLWDGQKFQPRLMLPISLSYDHRVINGASAVRFTSRLNELLSDIRRMLL